MMIKRWRRIAAMVASAVVLGGCTSDIAQVDPPQVTLDVRSEERYQVGEDVVRIHVTASDPQGLELSFTMVDQPERASLQTYANSAVFIWDPITSDVTGSEPRRLIFVVTNSRGGTTERVVNVYIEPGNTRPKFTSSESQLYNPSSGEAIEFEVKARDDDSPQVVLSMPAERAPEGATFEQHDSFEGTFSWMPSPPQLEKRMHTVVFIADDGDNEAVEQTVTIIIQNRDTAPGQGGGDHHLSCDGQEKIEHQPLGPQRSAQDYAIQGRILDTSQTWEGVGLYWTLDDPMEPSPEYEAELLEFDGTSFSGVIPNPLVGEGESAVISYTICAYGQSEGDEGVICAPGEFYYRFVAYAPGEVKCRDDGLGFNSPGQASAVSVRQWDEFRVCQGLENFHELELLDGEVVEVAISYPPGQTAQVEMALDGVALEVEDYPCEGWISAWAQGPGTVTVQVAGDEFPYHITGYLEGPACRGEHYEPDNTPGLANLIASDFKVYDDVAICTEEDIDIYAVELARGDEITAIIFFEHEFGDLDLTLFSPSQSSQVVQLGYGVAQSWSSNDDEEIFYVAEESGFYYLSVTTADHPNDYELIVEKSCVVDDAFAGNHRLEDASPVGPAHYPGLKLCAGQSDWYTLIYEGSESVLWMGEVEPSYGSAPEMEVIVYDEAGAVVEEASVVNGRRDFYIEPEAGEIFYIEVSSSRPMIYDLRVDEY